MTQSMTQSTAQKAREHPIVTVITVIGSLAAIYAVVHSLAPDPVERPLAEQFLTRYYAMATKDPSKCCLNELDGTYLAAHPAVRRDYVSFFRQFKSIDVSHVRDTPDGYFRALVTYHWADGTPASSETDRFKLVCSKWTEVPTLDCGVTDIKIDDVTNRFR
jgi:hypothetical protein